MKEELEYRSEKVRDYFNSIPVKSYMPLLVYANLEIRNNELLQRRIGRVMSGRINGTDGPVINEIEKAVDYLKEHGYK